MMKHSLVIALVLGLAGMASADLTFYGPADQADFAADSLISMVETFDAVTPKDTRLSSFVSQGVTYTGIGGSPTPNVWVTSYSYGNFGVPVPDATVLTANGDEDFMMDVSAMGPITAVGFDTYLNAYGPATIQILNDDGWTATALAHDPTMVGFFGVTSDSPIAAIRWTTVNGRAINTGIDNVQYGTVVPVPSAALLAMVGLGTVRWPLRRRRGA